MPKWFPSPLADATRRLQEERRAAMARLATQKPRQAASFATANRKRQPDDDVLATYLKAWLGQSSGTAGQDFWVNQLNSGEVSEDAARTARRYDWV